MTLYRTLVADSLFDVPLDLPAGFRIVEAGPLDPSGRYRTVLVADAHAPAHLAGKLVDPTVCRDRETGTAIIGSYRVVDEPDVLT